jgi:transposase-like protein
VNANQVSAWRQLYRQGLLKSANGRVAGLLPVRIVETPAAKEAVRVSRETQRLAQSAVVERRWVVFVFAKRLERGRFI